MEVGITYKGRGVKNEVDEFSNETYREEKKTSINGTLNIFKNRTGKNLHLEGIFNCFFSSIYKIIKKIAMNTPLHDFPCTFWMAKCNDHKAGI